MSCPDWRLLAAQKDSGAWDGAVAHFDEGCRLCRRDALAAEPTLVFRQLRSAAAAPVMTPAQEASEVDAVRQAVAAMRTASRVEAAGRRTRHGAGWTRWAAAAVLAAAALSIPADNGWSHRPGRQERGSRQAAAVRGDVRPAAFGASGPPAFVGVDRPGARVYNMDGEGLSVVMIVDESFDV
jgi:hypothetical protein